MSVAANHVLSSGPLAVEDTLDQGYGELLRADAVGRRRGEPLLTEAGMAFVLREAEPQAWPRWEEETRRLWLGDRVLREFRQPAPNQTLLLAAFQESEWREQRIDDPLPPQAGESAAEAKVRLQQTIKNLNRLLPEGSIRFRGDGTGQGVFWEHLRTAKTPRRRSKTRPGGIIQPEKYPKATPCETTPGVTSSPGLGTDRGD